MVELRGVEPCLIPFKTIGIKHFCVVRVHFRVHFKHNTAEAGRLIPTSAVLLHLAALLCQYSTARLVRRQVKITWPAMHPMYRGRRCRPPSGRLRADKP